MRGSWLLASNLTGATERVELFQVQTVFFSRLSRFILTGNQQYVVSVSGEVGFLSDGPERSERSLAPVPANGVRLHWNHGHQYRSR